MLVTYPKIVLECAFDEVHTIMYAVANKYTSDDILRGHWKFYDKKGKTIKVKNND